jgi:hypothetical protein
MTGLEQPVHWSERLGRFVEPDSLLYGWELMTRTESAQRRLQVADVETRPRWVHSAAADLLIGCGAWTAPLLALTYLVSTRRRSTERGSGCVAYLAHGRRVSP